MGGYQELLAVLIRVRRRWQAIRSESFQPRVCFSRRQAGEGRVEAGKYRRRRLVVPARRLRSVAARTAHASTQYARTGDGKPFGFIAIREHRTLCSTLSAVLPMTKR